MSTYPVPHFTLFERSVDNKYLIKLAQSKFGFKYDDHLIINR
jgi:hypothetical protein